MSQTSTSGAIPGQRAALNELPDHKTPVPPHLTKAVIRNFRLLRETELSFTDDVTLCVGRNNTGKTSLAKLFKLFLAKKDSVIRLEDFSAECYAEFLDAHRLYMTGEKEQANGRIPKVTLTLHIAYDANCGQYGPLSSFIVDLDPDCSEVVIRFTYALRDSALDAFLGDLVNSEDTALLEQLARRISSHFGLSVTAVDPIDDTNVRKVELADVKKLLRVDFLDAQRGLDDEDREAAQPIGAIFENLFTSAKGGKRVEWLEDLAKRIDKMLTKTSSSLDVSLQEIRTQVAPALTAFGYPGLGNQEFVTAARLDSRRLLRNFARIHYPGAAGVRFPESYSGLGTRNLVMMLLKLFTYYREHTAQPNELGIHLVFLEEPEAHLHPQMQEVFIQQLLQFPTLFPRLDSQMRANGPQSVGMTDTIGSDNENGSPWNAQFVVTTHSAHVANRTRFSNIRYFRKEEEPADPGGEPRLARTVIKDLSQVSGDQKFLLKYLTLTRADLYFADKAILVEGASERIFVPAAEEKLTAQNLETALSHQYVTLMEVGGAYAHKFYPLLRILGIPTLIITDLDPMKESGSDSRKCTVSEGGHTSNQSIQKWFKERGETKEGGETKVAKLLSRAEADAPVAANLCLAYQVPEQPGGPCGRTFEDAFVLANPALFGLSTRRAMTTNASLEKRAHNKVDGKGSKVDFALKYVLGEYQWEVPKYIKRGLEWLMKQDGTTTKTDDE
ncbi:ATP-dependent nuclease [Streptomyces alkaliphilus]|uniref:ATP-dependent nuclease n=1 Tax=Streptomyces alkaliphilus TaxID=1472722 RepID=UPI0015F7B8FF|nr:ATP-dependent endonuclease [Streptomyces alkaliphilus]